MRQRLLFRVNGDPKGKGRHRFTRSGRAYTPKETKAYEQEIRQAALKAATVQGWLKTDEALQVRIYACFAVPRSWSKKKRAAAFAGNEMPKKKPDADNVAKAVLDAMNDIVYHDDTVVCDLQISKRYVRSDDDNPHVTVFVVQVEKGNS